MKLIWITHKNIYGHQSCDSEEPKIFGRCPFIPDMAPMSWYTTWSEQNTNSFKRLHTPVAENVWFTCICKITDLLTSWSEQKSKICRWSNWATKHVDLNIFQYSVMKRQLVFWWHLRINFLVFWYVQWRLKTRQKQNLRNNRISKLRPSAQFPYMHIL